MNFAQRLTPALQNSSDAERRNCNINFNESADRAESGTSKYNYSMEEARVTFNTSKVSSIPYKSK